MAAAASNSKANAQELGLGARIAVDQRMPPLAPPRRPHWGTARGPKPIQHWARAKRAPPCAIAARLGQQQPDGLTEPGSCSVDAEILFYFALVGVCSVETGWRAPKLASILLTGGGGGAHGKVSD